MRVNATTRRVLATKIGRELGVTVRQIPKSERDGCAGQTDPASGVIEYDPEQAITQDKFISDLLHEAAHVWAKRKGIYKIFHSSRDEENMSLRELRIYMATAWKAERWVEQQAAMWMAIMFPGHTYWFAYGADGMNKDFVDEYELKSVRKLYRRKKLRAIDRAVRAARRGN